MSYRPKILTVKGAAERCGCSERPIRDAIRSGRIAAKRCGLKYLIPESEIVFYIAKRKENAKA